MGVTAVITAGIEALGVGAETAAAIAPVLLTAGEGAALGAASAGISGGNIGQGALLGGLTGGLGGAGTAGLEAAGLGSTAAALGGDVLGGMAAAGITGGNVLKGAEGGLLNFGIGQALNGVTNAAPGSGTAGTAATPGSGVSSAAGTAAPSSLGAISPDATAPVDLTADVTAGGGTAAQTTGTGSGGATGLPGAVGAGATAGGGVTAAGSGTAGDQFGAASVAAPATTTGASASSLATPITGGGGMPEDLLAGTPYGVTSQPTLGGVATPASGGPTDLLAGTPYAGAGAGTTGGGGFGSNILSGLTKNPLATVGALGMGANLLLGNKTPTNFNNLEAAAGEQQKQAAMLQSSLSSGQLPPGLQAGVDQALNASVASIKSHYASRGMSGSSAEAQDIQNAHNQAAAQAGQIATQLYQTGVTEMGMSDQLYQQLMQTSIQQDANTSASIGNFAKALATMGS